MGTATLEEQWALGMLALLPAPDQKHISVPLYPGSHGCIYGPVAVIICDPGIAGQAPRQDGVMQAMLAAKL